MKWNETGDDADETKGSVMNGAGHLHPTAKLPTYSRQRPVFESIFPRSMQDTIAAMDAAGDDIPRQTPEVPLTINRVGLVRAHIPVFIRDPFESGQRLALPCTVAVALEVPPAQRGIHVSRIGHIMALLAQTEFASLAEYARAAAQRIFESHQTPAVSVQVSGILTYLENVAYIKQKASLDHLTLTAEARYGKERFPVTTGLGFTHITACPCVQATFHHSVKPAGNSAALVAGLPLFPAFTHSQRCHTHLRITSASNPPALSQLLATIDAVLIRSQNTLPRGLELLNVVQAHLKPQFLEDILRELVRAIWLLLRDFPAETRIAVESSSMESIHDFDLSGAIEYTLADLHSVLGAA